MQPIYLDHAAATSLNLEVFARMEPYLAEKFENPSGVYCSARRNRNAIDEARKVVADILMCLPEEVFFTGSGTEANNWAIFGAANATVLKHIIITSVEHHSILYPAKELERRGYTLTILPVDPEGFVDIADFEKKITPEVFLTSVMYGNNEIGTVEHIASMGILARKDKVIFHTDACQAAGQLPLNVQELNVDMMTLNGGKIYGPRGVGVLYIRKGTPITPLLYGGGQEHRLRAGTENVAAIVGFAEALRMAENMRTHESARLTGLRDNFIQKILTSFPKAHLNGSPTRRLSNNINITFPGVDAESLLIQLDMEGVCASAGSACTSGSFEPSHVLLGIGLSKEEAKSSIRFTLGRENTEDQLTKVIGILRKIVKF